MAHSPPILVAAESFMANKAREYFHIFAEGGLSFFAFLLSIFIYVSVFNLSLSTLFNETKFWFCISNTLILIIAADYGAFSPSRQKLELHDHHGEADLRNSSPSFTSHQYQPDESPNKLTSIPMQEKEVVIVQERENPEDKLQIVFEGRASDKPRGDIGCEKKKIPPKTYRRSKSEKAKRVVVDEDSKITMTRSKTIKLETTKELEENVYAEMTDEELNRRVEEFIQRFNRQIRLQDIGQDDEV